MSSKKKQNKFLQKNTEGGKNQSPDKRIDHLDALRGFAMVWMLIFHFCFDLNYFGFMQQNFYEDNFWTVQRSCIVSLFLLCAGAGQALSITQGQSWVRFWKRWKQVAAGAVLVTVSSFIIYPNSFIYFGVLHAIALMLILMRLTFGFKQWLWLTGIMVIALKFVLPAAFNLLPSLDIFNSVSLNWLGIISYKPRTEDYVPLIPWLGVMWLGLAIGAALIKNNSKFNFVLPVQLKPLAVLGRYSLSFYLIHQPVLFGIIMFVKKMI